MWYAIKLMYYDLQERWKPQYPFPPVSVIVKSVNEYYTFISKKIKKTLNYSLRTAPSRTALFVWQRYNAMYVYSAASILVSKSARFD